jgi:hypothetical protein
MSDAVSMSSEFNDSFRLLTCDSAVIIKESWERTSTNLIISKAWVFVRKAGFASPLGVKYLCSWKARCAQSSISSKEQSVRLNRTTPKLDEKRFYSEFVFRGLKKANFGRIKLGSL